MKNRYLFLAGMLLSLSLFGVVRAANIEGVTNANSLELDGSLHFGDSQDIRYVTMPTAATAGPKYAIKVPFYNGNSASTAIGTVIVASVTAGGTGLTPIGYGNFVAALATTTVIGVSDGIYPAGTNGWMVISGYCQVLTTGTVHIGDILVSTGGTAGAGAAGYAGVATGTQVVGAMIGKAMSIGTAAGGLTTILMSR